MIATDYSRGCEDTPQAGSHTAVHGIDAGVTGIRSSADLWCAMALLMTAWNLWHGLYATNYFRLSTAIGGAVLSTSALLQCRGRRLLVLLSACLVPSLMCMDLINRTLTRLLLHTRDPIMARLDHGVSTAVYRWAEAHHGAAMPFMMIYCGLPLFMGCVLAVSPLRGRCAWALASAGLFGVCCYVAFPATGPAHIGDPNAPRNCMPSVRLTWALLLTFYTQLRWRWISALFAVGTAIATLTTGEHYMLDLLAAVPYSLMVFLATKWCRRLSLTGRILSLLLGRADVDHGGSISREALS